MNNKLLFSMLSFITVILLITLLAWLTGSDQDDPCANPQQDISAAVLAEGDADQEGMVNRAMLVRGACEAEQKSKDQD